MCPENNNFNSEQKFEISDKLKEDLKNLYKTSAKVPPEVNRAILDRASQKLTRPRKRLHIFRWAGPVAAAAAIIIFACVFINQGSPVDIDRNGRVDILDAFKLAKHIESVNKPDKKWDINGDGLVDTEDVDLVASAAVSLSKGVYQ